MLKFFLLILKSKLLLVFQNQTNLKDFINVKCVEKISKFGKTCKNFALLRAEMKIEKYSCVLTANNIRKITNHEYKQYVNA